MGFQPHLVSEPVLQHHAEDVTLLSGQRRRDGLALQRVEIIGGGFFHHQHISLRRNFLASHFQQRLDAQRLGVSQVKPRRHDAQRRLLCGAKLHRLGGIVQHLRLVRAEIMRERGDRRARRFLRRKFLACLEKQKCQRQQYVHQRCSIQFFITIQSFSVTDSRILPSNTANPLALDLVEDAAVNAHHHRQRAAAVGADHAKQRSRLRVKLAGTRRLELHQLDKLGRAYVRPMISLSSTPKRRKSSSGR